MSKIIVVGGGAAGTMAAITAARNGHEVHLFEKNTKLGRKLFITGKGRCNITNASDIDIIFENVVSNRKFLYSALYGYTNQDVIDFFERLGCKTKVERGNRVFPVSDKSSDVIGALMRECNRVGVNVHFQTEISDVIIKDGQFEGVRLVGETGIVKGDKVIIATGGLSYPLTGSTGDGYRFAKEMGLAVTDLYPSLVSVHMKEDYVKELQGLSLKNIQVKLLDGKKCVYENFGELVFTQRGVSGPVVLSASSYAIPYIKKGKQLTFTIDLKPALSIEQLDARILRDFEEFTNKQYKNALDNLLPRKLIGVIIELSGIHPEKKVNLITREERQNLVNLLKDFRFHVERLGDFKEAVITKGGVSVKEINPTTMEAKNVKNVYYVGEVLDLDALTGGYNLQIAWSTGVAAGNSV